MDHPEGHAAAIGGELFGRDDHADGPLGEEEHAREELRGDEYIDIRGESAQDREERVAEDRDREHTGAPPDVGLSDQPEREDGPDVDGPNDVSARLQREVELFAEVGEDLSERKEVVAFKEGRDAEEEEELPLVRSERRLHALAIRMGLTCPSGSWRRRQRRRSLLRRREYSKRRRDPREPRGPPADHS